jgi:1-acyl-sn-glycerol-3-phosphate acyltransferase
MQNIVIDKPYVPVPPYRGRFWPTMIVRWMPRLLRKSFGITQVECVNVDRLKQAIAAGHGILLTPNHCRDEDPLVLSALSRMAETPFFIMASWHVFMQGKMQAFLLRRAGGFSVYREGIDRGAVSTAIEILENAERPLVIFPEGVVSRTNEKLNPLMDGITMMARQAARKRAKAQPPGKVVIFPIAIRYRFMGDIETAASKVLDEIESRLTWTPSRETALIDRIVKVGTALLTLKELEYLDHPQTGTIGERLQGLIHSILAPLEDEWVKSDHDGTVPMRVKRLRTAILPDLVKGDLDESERQRRWKQLTAVYLAQTLWNFPPDYLRSNPAPQRMLETIERFEEGLTDRVGVHGALHATVTVGQAIEVAPAREGRGTGADPILQNVQEQLESMLGIEAADAAPPATSDVGA